MLRIQFGLAWHKSGKNLKGSFKHADALGLFDEYRERIEKFTPCEASGIERFRDEARNPSGGLKVWVCDRSAQSRTLSSEEVAREFSKTLDGGAKKLWVMIGGPDGFSREALAEFKPNLLWSFGKLTLPHELAAVVAAEQLYRAWSIIKGLPYHSAH